MTRAPASLAPSTNEQLLALVAKHDERALAELYERLGRASYGVALRVVCDRALAEDAVQEAFLTVWRAAGGFAPDRSAATWILTLVHRRAVDIVRREERVRRGSVVYASPGPQAGEPGEGVDASTRAQSVRAALEMLPARQRQAIELAYYSGFTVSEIAERLGESPGAVKKRLSAGLGRLAFLLDRDGEALARGARGDRRGDVGRRRGPASVSGRSA